MNDYNTEELIVVEGMAEALVIKTKLESFSIPCMLKYESAGRLFGITMNGIGKVKIIVNKEDFEKAKELLNESARSI